MEPAGEMLEYVVENGVIKVIDKGVIRLLNDSLNSSSPSENGHHPDSNLDPDFDTGNPLQNPSEKKALENFKAAQMYMGFIDLWHDQLAYRARVDKSKTLRAVEKTKGVLWGATSVFPLDFLHAILPKPLEALENIVGEEIAAMKKMQDYVNKAISHSEATVNRLEQYDAEVVAKFDQARKSFISYDGGISRMQAEISQLEVQVDEMPKADPEYVPLKRQLDGLKRKEKNAVNARELAAQTVVYTDKQSALVQVKENVVRMGLHQLTLVSNYTQGFLDFVQHTRSADAMIPQLVETAKVLGESYRILSGIFENGNAATTKEISALDAAIKGITHKVYPTALGEATKQEEALGRIASKTTFTEQASQLLGTERYDAGPVPKRNYEQAVKPQAQSASSGSA